MAAKVLVITRDGEGGQFDKWGGESNELVEFLVKHRAVLFARHQVEEDGHMVRRDMPTRQGEIPHDKLFEEADMIVDQLPGFRFKPFEMNMRLQDERVGIVVEILWMLLRKKLLVLASFQVCIDSCEHPLAEPKGTRRFVARPEHDNPAEQPLVDPHVHMVGVVVKGPRSQHLVGHVEGVGPGLARTDRVGTAAVMSGLRAERPRAVGIDSVAQAVNVKRVRDFIAIPDVNLEPLAGAGVDDRPGHAVIVDRLVDVGQDQLVRLRNKICGIEVFAVDDCAERTCVNLGLRNEGTFVSLVAHAVAAVLHRRYDLVLRLHWIVAFDALDLQVDVPFSAGRWLDGWHFDDHLDVRVFDVPEHGILGARDQVATGEDLEIDVRPVVQEEIPEHVFVKRDRERAVGECLRGAEVIVDTRVLVPGLDSHSRDVRARARIDHLTFDFVVHRCSFLFVDDVLTLISK